jgi:uncharacterized membrane protein YfcA
MEIMQYIALGLCGGILAGLLGIGGAIVIVPALGGKLPAMILTSVDLPAPLSPTIATTSRSET